MEERGGIKFTKSGPVYPRIANALERLGADIALARRARRISTTEFAESMGVSRTTLYRLEHGDANISINTLALALRNLGLLDAFAHIADETDDVTMMLIRKSVPHRAANLGPDRSGEDKPAPVPGPDQPDDPTDADEMTPGW